MLNLAARGNQWQGGRAKKNHACQCQSCWHASNCDAKLVLHLTVALLPSLAATDARHGLAKMAANLKGSGERYAYALHLLAYHSETCSQLHMDIMCKWSPWLQRTVFALLQDPPADASAELRARILQLRQLVAAADIVLLATYVMATHVA